MPLSFLPLDKTKMSLLLRSEEGEIAPRVVTSLNNFLTVEVENLSPKVIESSPNYCSLKVVSEHLTGESTPQALLVIGSSRCVPHPTLSH